MDYPVTDVSELYSVISKQQEQIENLDKEIIRLCNRLEDAWQEGYDEGVVDGGNIYNG